MAGPNVKIKIDGDSKGFVKESNKAIAKIKAIEKTSEAANSAIQRAFGVIAVGALAATARQAIDTADQMGKLAQRLGSTSEALSELSFVADRGGVSFRTLQLGLQRATRRISEAATGTGEAVKALKELNLSAVELNKLAPEDQFEAIAESISRLNSESDRVRLAMKLFDSEGVALIQTMGGGAEEIRALREEARRLGATISTDAAQSAAAFNDQMTILEFKMNGFRTKAAIPAAEAIVDIINALDVSSGKAEEAGNQFDFIKNSIKGVAAVGIGAHGAISGLSEAFVGLVFAAKEAGSGNLSRAIDELEEATRRANKAFDDSDEKIKKLFSNTPPPPSNGASSSRGGFSLDGLRGDSSDEANEQDLEKLRNHLDKRIEILDRSLLNENELMTLRANENLALVQQFRTNQLLEITKQTTDGFNSIDQLLQNKKISDVEAADQTFELLRKDAEKKEKLDKDSANRRLQIGKKYGLSLLGDAAKHSKAAFNIQKAAAIAEGALKAKESVLNAYEFGTGIGGPPVGAAFAALAGVAAFGQLQAIASSEFGGGGGANNSISSSGSAPIAESATIENESNNDQERPTQTIFIEIDGLGDEDLSSSVIRNLAEKINDARDSNVRIVV